jgi:hypothetical protein
VSTGDEWLTLREFGARLTDATAGQVKSVILVLNLGADDYRGEGEAREYSPNAQRAVIQALREKSLGARMNRSESSPRRST